jgi:hypothetical protein
MTREDIEQWVKDNPIEWHEAISRDEDWNEQKVMAERFFLHKPEGALFYVIESSFYTIDEMTHAVILTDNIKEYKRKVRKYICSGDTLEEAMQIAEEDRIKRACEALHIK